jgi:hypothetical protein
VWTPDGRHLLVIDGVPSSNGGVRRVPSTARTVRTARRLEHAASLALSRGSGRLAFHRPGIDVDIWRIDLRDPPAAAASRRPPCGEGADLSPDGTRLKFSSNRWARARSGWPTCPATSCS